MDSTTIETDITFKSPFSIEGFDGPQPAGTYRLLVEQEQLLGVSFPAFRRSALLEVPPRSVARVARQLIPVNETELLAALAADRPL